MQKCYYHGKTGAVTVCIGCKLPVCQTCKDEGKKGYCDTCLKNVAKLGDRLGDARKTVAAPAADMKTTISAPGRHVKYCRHHADILASAGCRTCNKPYCPSCLNSQGICSPCISHHEGAQAMLARPGARQKALSEAVPAAAPGPDRKKMFVVGVVAGIVLVGALTMLPKHGRSPSKTVTALEKLKQNDLTPQEKALIAKLKVEARQKTELADSAPNVAPRAAEAVYQPRWTDAAPAPAAALAAPRHVPRRLRVSVSAPAVARGMATLRASVSGEPDRVEFLVDGSFAGAANGWPYAIEWASQGVGNGRHRVTVEAYGVDGGKAIASTSIVVRN